MSWHVLSRVVVRRTGFPFELLERLSVDALAAPVAAAGRAELAVAAAGRAALAAFPAAVSAARSDGDRPALRRLSRLRRAVATGALNQRRLAAWGTGLPEPLAGSLTHLLACRNAAAAAADALRQAVAAQRPRLDRLLRETLTDRLFQEAVFLSNPDMYGASLAPLAADPHRPVDPALARAGWAYLQRFAGKNDTASFFGPLNYASLVDAPGPPVRIQTVSGRWRRRDVFLSYWAVRAVAERIAADPAVRPWLRPRRHPMAGREITAGKPGGRISPELAEVAAAADGHLSTAEIAQKLGRAVEETAAAVAELVTGRVLIATLDVPSTRFHPYQSLRRRVAELDARCARRDYWRHHLDEGERLRTALASAEFSDRPALVEALDTWFTDLTGQPPRRGEGATYADRTLFYEDCEGTHERFEFSRPFASDLMSRLHPVLDLCAAHGSLLARRYQRSGRALFDELSPSGAPVPYLTFATRMLARERAGALPATGDEVAELRSRLTDLVTARSDGRVARLRPADIDELVRDVPPLANCHTSPDIMISAPDLDAVAAGDYQLVLGEVHQVVYAWGSQLYFDRQREQTEREAAAHIARMPEYENLAIVLTERRHKGLLHEVFPGTFIEVAAAGPEQARSRVPIADLVVAPAGDGLVLRHRDSGERFQLYMAGEEQLHLWTFALPRLMPVPVSVTDRHTPRIVVGGTVYQRERWRIPVSDWGADLTDLDEPGLLRRAAAVRATHDLPRHVYLQVASEPKPYYVDFLAPLALRTLQHLARTNDQLTFTEMLPDPDGLWLREPEGRFCCEFRMTAFRY